MKKIIKSILLSILLINLGLTLQMSFVSAADTDAAATSGATDSPDETGGSAFPSIQEMVEAIGRSGDTGLPQFKFGQHPDAPNDYVNPGVGAATSPIYFVIDLFRYAISGIALIMIVVYAIKLVSVSSEEDAGKLKTGLSFAIVGLLLIQLADIIVKEMFFGDSGQAFEDPDAAQQFAEDSVTQLRGVIGFVEFFLGAVAVLVIIIRGFTLVVGGGEEESMKKAKDHILYALIGLAVVGLSEVVIRGFIFPEAGNALPDVDRGKQIIISVTNFLASFVAVLAFLMLFYAGYRYVVAGSVEETTDKVKKIVTGAVIALVIALGAFAAVNTLVKFEKPIDTAEVDLPESK